MKNLTKLTLFLALLIITPSCSKKEKIDPVAEQLELQRKEMEERERERKIEDDLREKEAKRKEEVEKRAEKERSAPIRSGEFKLSILPDQSVASKFLVPVHIMTMKQEQAGLYRAMTSANYWKNPSPLAKEIKFGTSGQVGAYNGKIPFQSGDDTLIIITKIPGASQSETIIIRSLERNNDLSTTPVTYSLTASGFRAL